MNNESGMKMMNLLSGMMSKETLIQNLLDSCTKYMNDKSDENFREISMYSALVTMKDMHGVMGKDDEFDGIMKVNEAIDKGTEIKRVINTMRGDTLDKSKSKN